MTESCPERIMCAAILYNMYVWTGPSHDSIIRCIVQGGVDYPVRGPQGFFTSRLRFVDREHAREIAIAAGQVEPAKTLHRHELFSEDLRKGAAVDEAKTVD